MINKLKHKWKHLIVIFEFKKDFRKWVKYKFYTTQRTISKRGVECDNLYYYAQLDLLREINKQYKLKTLNEIK